SQTDNALNSAADQLIGHILELQPRHRTIHMRINCGDIFSQRLHCRLALIRWRSQQTFNDLLLYHNRFMQSHEASTKLVDCLFQQKIGLDQIRFDLVQMEPSMRRQQGQYPLKRQQSSRSHDTNSSEGEIASPLMSDTAEVFR